MPPSSTPGTSSEGAARAFVASVQRAVDARLAEHLDRAKARATDVGDAARAVLDAYDALVRRGGKRLRPAMTLAAFAACGGAPDPESSPDDGVLDAACAWELLQAYFLVHDDWMDGDAVRRGGPAVHADLTEKLGDSHMGASMAILAGDLGCALAHGVLLGAKAEPEVVREATEVLARVHEEVVLGQIVDVRGEAKTRESVERMHRAKTASYTVRGPIEVGAIFARASTDQRAALRRFADPIGLAFQLRDDLLGVFGDTRQTGKPVASDIRARKPTALLLETRDRLVGADRSQFDLIFSVNRAMTDDETAWVVERVQASGARDALERRVQTLVDDATAGVRDARLEARGAELLVGLAILATKRSA